MPVSRLRKTSDFFCFLRKVVQHLDLGIKHTEMLHYFFVMIYFTLQSPHFEFKIRVQSGKIQGNLGGKQVAFKLTNLKKNKKIYMSCIARFGTICTI